MKRCIAGFIAVLIIFLLASCSGSEKIKVELTEELSAEFADAMTLDEIMNDVRKIDMHHKMNTDGLTSERVEDKENSTAETYYKNSDGETIYIEHEGFGENGFSYFTKSASGKKLKVGYYEEMNEVVASTDDYTVHFGSVNDSAENGADVISVTARLESDYILDESISYAPGRNGWFVDTACCFTDEGYKQYVYWFEDNENGGEYKIDGSVLYKRITEEPSTDITVLTDEKITVMPEFVAGCSRFSYLDSPDGKWYLTADFVLTFEDEETRDYFAKKYGLTNENSQGNESEAITLRTGEITVPVADDCEGFEDMIRMTETDDCFYVSVALDDSGEIVEMSRGGLYSFY